MTAADIVKKYISFFEKRGHTRIVNSPLVLANDPTTLFTSSGMQPLVPYLLGEQHPEGVRLVNVQNSFRAQDIDEIGDNRHTTFFRMLGNWSLGDYFKKEQLPWIFEFLTNKQEGLGLDPKRLYVTVFAGNDHIEKDTESIEIWKQIFQTVEIDAKVGERIFEYSVEKNWWSRSGPPDKMPAGEPGGPDSEVFYEFEQVEHDLAFGQKCHVNCDCGRFVEICNSVFMQYQKQKDGSFKNLPKQNVDFGGGLERMLLAVEDTPDVFTTNLFQPIIESIEQATNTDYKNHAKELRIIADHFTSAVFIAKDGVFPSNKEQGYILRRLIRRGLDNWYALHGTNIEPVLQVIVRQYQETDPSLAEKYEHIKDILLEEEQKYKRTRTEAQKFIEKKYKHSHPEAPAIGSQKDSIGRQGDLQNDKGATEISSDDAFILYTTHGLSPSQIKNLGYIFNDQEFAEKMKSHQDISRNASAGKFKGGLADHEEKTIMGHTATHLLHQALRDVLGDHVHQTGSNITTERVRFDFNYDQKPTDEQIKKITAIVNEKIKENLPVHFEMIETAKAKDMGAIGLFMDTYGEKSKIYFIGDYSTEFCGGPHVDFTGVLKSFTIIKQENLGQTQKRIYGKVNA